MKSFCAVAAAAEVLSKGVDISEWDSKDLVNYFKDKEDTFNILIDDATKDLFDIKSTKIYREKKYYYSKKDETAEFTPNLTLTIENTKSIMMALWEYGIELFPDIKEEDYIPDYENKLKEIDKDFDCKLKMIEELSRDKTDEALKIFLALFNYPNDYSKKLYEDSKKDKVFHLTKAKDFDIIDNRLYIWVKPSMLRKISSVLKKDGYEIDESFQKIKAFVISKNVYDYFWASYGNEFQSCFSLSSEYGYLYGYVPFSMADESFICYATTGGVNKIPIVAGKQFKCPNMLFRCWGYADEKGNLLVDKRYLQHSDKRDAFVETLFDILKPYINLKNDKTKPTKRKLYNNGEGIKVIFNDIKCKFYADSLRWEGNDIVFTYGNGGGGTGTNNYPWSSTYRRFTDYASTIREISPTLSLDKQCSVVNGVLLNPKLCPVTGLLISDDESKSPFAKFYTQTCAHSAIITYIDGQVFLDNLTKTYVDISKIYMKGNPRSDEYRGFAGGKLYILPYRSKPYSDSRDISLKSLKELLKGAIDSTGLDGILLRYFEGYEVKYQFYKAKGNS